MVFKKLWKWMHTEKIKDDEFKLFFFFLVMCVYKNLNQMCFHSDACMVNTCKIIKLCCSHQLSQLSAIQIMISLKTPENVHKLISWAVGYPLVKISIAFQSWGVCISVQLLWCQKYCLYIGDEVFLKCKLTFSHNTWYNFTPDCHFSWLFCFY